MTKSRFDIEYKKWLQQVNVDEEDSVWNGIQDELDLNETWDNISANLDEIMPQTGWVTPVKYLKVLAVAAAIVLIIILPVRYYIEQSNHPNIIIEIINETDEKEELKSEEPILSKTAEEEVELVQGTETGINLSYDSSILSSRIGSDNELTSITESKDTEGNSFSNERLIMPEIKYATFNSDILLTSRDVLLAKTKVTEFSPTSGSIESSGLSIRVAEVGLVFGYKNTWLINHETLNGLNPRKLGNTLPTFHEDIGVTTSLELNNKHLFGLEFLWKSGTGQNYKQYINASFVDRRINLDYLKLQAFYFCESNRLPGQAIVGGYFASLTMAEEQKDKTIISVDDNYSDFDYGLLAGYEFNIALLNNIILKPGVRISYDLVNIFVGDDITPSHYKRTKNLAASFNISLSYRFYK